MAIQRRRRGRGRGSLQANPRRRPRISFGSRRRGCHTWPTRGELWEVASQGVARTPTDHLPLLQYHIRMATAAEAITVEITAVGAVVVVEGHPAAGGFSLDNWYGKDTLGKFGVGRQPAATRFETYFPPDLPCSLVTPHSRQSATLQHLGAPPSREAVPAEPRRYDITARPASPGAGLEGALSARRSRKS